MTNQTSPIEAALARVCELREAEKRMTPGPWHSERGNAGVDHPHFLIRQQGDGIRFGLDRQSDIDVDSTAALRNAAEPMLGLLEALLADYGIVEFAVTRSTSIKAALAAFVEGRK